MKKTYSKPQIVFDSFELSQNIAAGCEMIDTGSQPYSCPVVVTELGNDYTLFASNSLCFASPAAGNDSVCYHVPVEDNNVFSS